MKNKKIVVG